jgi:hypothetical protein
MNPYNIPYYWWLGMIFAEDKKKTIVFVMAMIILAYLIALIKPAFGRPRPYMTNSNVEVQEFYADYGYPADHCLIGIFLYFYLCEVLFVPWNFYVKNPPGKVYTEKE